MIQYFEPGSRSSSLGIDPRRNLQWILHSLNMSSQKLSRRIPCCLSQMAATFKTSRLLCFTISWFKFSYQLGFPSAVSLPAFLLVFGLPSIAGLPLGHRMASAVAAASLPCLTITGQVISGSPPSSLLGSCSVFLWTACSQDSWGFHLFSRGLQLVFFFFSKSLSSSSVEPPDIPPVMLHLKSRPSNPPVLSF